MRLGCIDIGSNTTRLLVAEHDQGRLEWIHQERAFTRIGHELQKSNRIGAAKVGEVVRVVAAQLETARAHGVGSIRAVATAAIRDADNGAELVDAVSAATGLTVEVLSAQEEARLAFVGVVGTLERPPLGELGVVDVGGGSSELVVGEACAGVRWWASVPLGSGTVSYTFLASDPPTVPELRDARRHISSVLAGLSTPRMTAAVAVGGSATSLARLAGPVLSGDALGRALELLAGAHSREIAARFEIDQDRARLLAAGLLILQGVTELFGVQLMVGRGGIREGVLLEAVRR